MAPDGGGRYTFPMLTRRALVASALAAPAAAQVDLGFADNGLRPITRGDYAVKSLNGVVDVRLN